MGNQVGDRNLAILGYHKIGEPSPGGWETWYYVPEATFMAQLGCLREDGWQVIDLETALRALAAPQALPERAALLTFDDGYRSLLDAGLSCLRHLGYPGVLFVPTAFIGGTNAFDRDIEPEEPICGWDDLRELERHGVSVQSHGVSHRAFSDLSAAEQEEELRRSRETLEAGLRRPVQCFSFPYGDAGADLPAMERMLERTGYRAACLYAGGLNRLPAAAPYRLARLAMGPDSDLRAMLRREQRRLLAAGT